MQSWVWRHVHLRLPDDWELLQFTRNPALGRCAFADRYQFRFELCWREVPGAPDFARMLTDYQARLDEDGLQDTRRIQCAGWQGVSGVLPDRRTTCRYGAHLADLGCLVEAVFLWPKDRRSDIESAVLESLHSEAPTAEGLVHWQAFGLDLHTGRGGRLEYCRADPGLAEFGFSFGRRRVWERFSRRGLLAQWLTVPVPEWQRRSIPKGFRMLQSRQEDQHGHSIARLSAERSSPRLADFWQGRREYRAAAWRCPHDGRLYQVSREAPRGRGVDPRWPPVSLRCCADLEVVL